MKYLCGLICIYTCYILSRGDVIGQRCHLMQVSHFCSNPLLSLFVVLLLLKPSVLFSHAVLLSSSASINHPLLSSSSSSSSADPLFMFFHPTLVLSLTVNLCVSFEDISRGSCTGVRADVALLCKVNTPKDEAPLTHSLTDWKTDKTQCGILSFFPFVSLTCTQFLFLKRVDLFAV